MHCTRILINMTVVKLAYRNDMINLKQLHILQFLETVNIRICDVFNQISADVQVCEVDALAQTAEVGQLVICHG